MGHIVLRSVNIEWWQDPGYRTLKHFLSFGESLVYPIYSAVIGIWDSLYSTFWMDGSLSGMAAYYFRPPWNYGFLVSGAWLSFLPAMAILLGMIDALWKPDRSLRNGSFFAALCVIIYVSAILYVYLKFPVYSTGKATYAVGITACFAILCVRGLDILMRKPLIKSTVYGIIACWAVSVYISYFVI
jgi:hypothetical protein